METGAVTVTDARWLPDGRHLVVIGAEERRGRRAYVLNMEDGSSRAISPPGLGANEMPIGWTADAKLVLVMTDVAASRIDRVNVTSGRRERWIELRPPDPGLLGQRVTLALDRGRRSYAANYQRVQSELYLVEGLR